MTEVVSFRPDARGALIPPLFSCGRTACRALTFADTASSGPRASAHYRRPESGYELYDFAEIPTSTELVERRPDVAARAARSGSFAGLLGDSRAPVRDGGSRPRDPGAVARCAPRDDTEMAEIQEASPTRVGSPLKGSLSM